VAFTSIATTGGWADDAVAQTAYDLMFGWELSANAICYPLVDVSPKNVPHRGASVTMTLNDFFGESEITAGMTPLAEESDVTPSQLPAVRQVVLTPEEYGRAVSRTLKLANRGLIPIDPVIGKAVAKAGRDTIDRLVQTTMRSGSQVEYAGAATSTATVADGHDLTAEDIRRVVTGLRGQNVETKDGQFYVGVFHPDVIHDLRKETGSGSWRVPNEYGQSQEKIWKGEFGEFEGVRFIQTSTTLWDIDKNDGAAGARVYRSYILGAEALAKCEITPLQSVVSPVVDKLKRFAGLGWYADLDFALYRPEALYRLESHASVAPAAG
jgi:N4-gp56 family major capsid protein